VQEMVSCKKLKSKKLHNTYWDGYHMYQDKIKEWEKIGLVERGERSLNEFIV
jgi:hypothetical protein